MITNYHHRFTWRSGRSTTWWPAGTSAWPPAPRLPRAPACQEGTDVEAAPARPPPAVTASVGGRWAWTAVAAQQQLAHVACLRDAGSTREVRSRAVRPQVLACQQAAAPGPHGAGAFTHKLCIVLRIVYVTHTIQCRCTIRTSAAPGWPWLGLSGTSSISTHDILRHLWPARATRRAWEATHCSNATF